MTTYTRCAACGAADVVRVPDNPGRYASGNNIYTTRVTLTGKIPVIRYVCCTCGHVENRVEGRADRDRLRSVFGA